MTGKQPYEYIVLRYRHDPVADEVVNVGVVLQQPSTGYLAAKMRHTYSRISRLFPDLDADAFKRSLKTIEDGINHRARAIHGNPARPLPLEPDDIARMVVKYLPDDDSSFIWGKAGSGICEDAESTHERLFERFVAKYDDQTRVHRDDAAVWRPVREELAARKIADKLIPITVSSPRDVHRFEYAWKNGAYHCYQAVSFDLASSDTIRAKARGWAGQLVALQDAEPRFNTHFIVGAPATDELYVAYRAAIEILRASPGRPQVYEEDQIAEMVDDLEDMVRAQERAL